MGHERPLRADTLTFAAKTIRLGRLYCYRVIATNDVGSSVSDEVCLIHSR